MERLFCCPKYGTKAKRLESVSTSIFIYSAAAAAAAMQKISRKQKSLGLLCDKFVQRFPESVPEGEKCEIHLDDLAKQMGTERRRIYDIVNVLESVQMMTKVSNKYALPKS